MKNRMFLAVTALSVPTLSHAAPTILAYYTGTASDASLQTNASKIQTLAADRYAIDSSGALKGSMPSNVKAVTDANGIALYAVISNFGTSAFDAAIAHAILKTGPAQINAIKTMVALARTNGIAGINLDFESVTRTDRRLMTRFVQKLATALHAISRKLIVSVPATHANTPGDTWTGAFDYAAIGAASDLVQVMTYDQNGPWRANGPVAGLNWVQATIAYAASVMPRAKISMGIAAYGYDWNLTDVTGVQVKWNAIPALIASTGATPVWDSASSSPEFHYVSGGKAHVVWYENTKSIRIKAQYALSQNIASVSIWSLGQEDATFWSALSDHGGNASAADTAP